MALCTAFENTREQRAKDCIPYVGEDKLKRLHWEPLTDSFDRPARVVGSKP
ncbi:MAG: hypothetical protein KC646_05725 [Candidatus Cloacimonetes bacterium]|nr:hypothetical protein [Candidatus Cloacimonadota bacterium]